MDRARLGLIPGLVAVVVLVLSSCGSPGGQSPGVQPLTAQSPVTTSSTALPSPSGYPLPAGQRFALSGGGKSRLTVRVGDVVVGLNVPDAVRVATESGVLAHAENAPDGPVFQAVRVGRAVIPVGESPAPASCGTAPCAGRTPPPTVTIEVS